MLSPSKLIRNTRNLHLATRQDASVLKNVPLFVTEHTTSGNVEAFISDEWLLIASSQRHSSHISDHAPSIHQHQRTRLLRDGGMDIG